MNETDQKLILVTRVNLNQNVDFSILHANTTDCSKLTDFLFEMEKEINKFNIRQEKFLRRKMKTKKSLLRTIHYFKRFGKKRGYTI